MAGFKWGFKWDEVDKHIGIFAPKDSNTLDGRIYESLQTTKNVAAVISTNKAVKAVSVGLELLPYIGPVVDVISDFLDILSHETDWKTKFSQEMRKEIQGEIVVDNIDNMETTLMTIGNYISLINHTIQNGDYSEKQNDSMKGYVNTIYTDFDKMITALTKPNSKFKHSPLLAAPFLIELSLFVSAFDPIQIAFFKRKRLSCKILYGLYDYMPFVVEDRLSKLNTNLIKLTELRNVDCNINGYDRWSHLDCNTEHCVETCITDEFSTKKYQRKVPGSDCERNYVLHLRHLVEKMFPLDQLYSTCDREDGDVTGN